MKTATRWNHWAALVAGVAVISLSVLAVIGTPGISRANEDEDRAALLKKRQQDFEAKRAELRKKYPFEAVGGLLDYEAERVKKLGDVTPKLTDDTGKRLERFEQSVESYGDRFQLRKRALGLLHAQEVNKFVERDGFGAARRPGPSLNDVELTPLSPVPFAAGTLTPEEAGKPVSLPIKGPAQPTDGLRLPSIDALGNFHLLGQMNFANGRGFGLIKDRDHVAGFEPHQFRNMPELADYRKEGEKAPAERWAVRRLELVSLLKHDEPVAYLSEKLPSMKELRKAKTRELSAFEKQSLKLLEDGEDLVVDATTNKIVMHGAIRAGKTCQQCHHTPRGALLGSFTYELHRDPPMK